MSATERVARQQQQQLQQQAMTPPRTGTARGGLTGSPGSPWVPDGASQRCQLCRGGFSLFVRRHHCRACGALACHACTRSRTRALEGFEGQNVRVCEPCALKLKTASSLKQRRGSAAGKRGDQQQQQQQQQQVRRRVSFSSSDAAGDGGGGGGGGGGGNSSTAALEGEAMVRAADGNGSGLAGPGVGAGAGAVAARKEEPTPQASEAAVGAVAQSVFQATVTNSGGARQRRKQPSFLETYKWQLLLSVLAVLVARRLLRRS